MPVLLRWIFDLLPSTPICVLCALARHRGLSGKDGYELTTKQIASIPFSILQRNLEAIPKIELPENRNEWTIRDYRNISRFVNPHEKWKKETLLEAYDDICRAEADTTSFPFVFNFAEKSVRNPTSCDTIMLYNYCRRANFVFTPTTTFTEMSTLYTLFTVPDTFTKYIPDATRKSSLLQDIFTHTQNPDLEWRTQDLSRNSLPPKPSNSNEAFFMALYRKEDYSLADSPLLEYLGIPGISYSRVKKVNKFRCVVGIYFNPYIPLEYYSYDKLASMAEEEGIDATIDPEMLHYYLTERSFQENFYHLLQPEVKATETYILNDTVSILNNYEIVCYGRMVYTRRDLEKATMDVYSFLELDHTFSTLGDFLNPRTQKPFGEEPMNKLYRIVTATSLSTVVPEKVRADAFKLITTIHLVNGKKGLLGERISEWLRMDPAPYREALKSLLETSMYMRGWQGPGKPYPIQKAPVVDQTKIDIAVGESLCTFNTQSMNLVPSIHDLPLFRHNGKNFIMSSCEFEGITIGDRIQKVLLGESVTQMSTCIRLSSNWLVSSAYYYLQLIGDKPNFNIEDLVDIA